MKPFHRRALVTSLALLAAAGCTTNRSDQERTRLMHEAIAKNDLATATAACNELYESARAGEPEEIGGSPVSSDSVTSSKAALWAMERGVIAQLNLDLAASDAFLRRATALTDEARTTSVSRTAGTYVGNDNLSEYVGFGFEHVQIDYLRMLNILVGDAVKAGRLTLPAGLVAAPAGAAASAKPPVLKPVASGEAINVGRGLVNVTLGKDAGLRYDAPWERAFAGAVVLTLDEPQSDDWNFAYNQLAEAIRRYGDQRRILTEGNSARYEVPTVPLVAAQLYAQVGRQHDADSYAGVLAKAGFKADDPRLAAPGPGQGRVLVLNHVGFVTPIQALTFRMGQGVGSIATAAGSRLTKEERALGFTSYVWSLGPTTFHVSGPNAEAIRNWGAAVTVTGEVMRQMQYIAGSGTNTVVEFQIPGQHADRPIAPPATVVVGGQSAKAEVVGDIDCYARATLRGRQPGVLTKTLLRTVGKQVTVAAAAVKAKKEGGALLGEAVSLLGSAGASVTEAADLRHWRTLPDHIEAALITVPAGTHPIAIDTPRGRVQVGTVTVPAGRLVVVPVHDPATGR
jgi:hypothetical protein